MRSGIKRLAFPFEIEKKYRDPVGKDDIA